MPSPDAPCPLCGAALAVPAGEDRGSCPSCGGRVRFVDVPERPCASCGKPVPVRPGAEALRCPHCRAVAAADPSRGVVARARCPRCRRAVRVGLADAQAECPFCGQAMALADTL